MFPEVARRHSSLLFERPVEIAQIVESAECGNFNNAFPGFRQQALGVLQTDPEQGLADCLSCLLPVSGTEMDMGDPEIRRRFPVVELLRIVPFQPGKNAGGQAGAAVARELTVAEPAHLHQEFHQIEFQEHRGVEVASQEFAAHLPDQHFDFPVSFQQADGVVDAVRFPVILKHGEEIVVSAGLLEPAAEGLIEKENIVN